MEPKNTRDTETRIYDHWVGVGRTIALYGALGTGAGILGIEMAEAHRREEIRVTYGTREDPRFRIGNVPLLDGVRSLDALLREFESESGAVPLSAVEVDATISDLERALAIIEDRLRETPPGAEVLEGWRRRFAAAGDRALVLQFEFNQTLPRYGALCEALRLLGDSATLNALDLDMQVIGADFERGRALEAKLVLTRLANVKPAEAISSVGYAKALFERVTGQTLPASVTMRRSDIAENGVVGTAEIFNQVITVEPMSFSEEVSTLCHEMGHLAARPSEEFEGRRGILASLRVGRSRDRAVLEEAAAYTFERVCISAIPDRSVREQATTSFESQMLVQAKLFFRGGTEIHCEAAVVSAATCRVVGGAAEAFNYLSTTSELSPAIRSAIEEVRREWETTPSGRCKKAADALRVLSKRVASLRERFDPEYAQ